MSFGVAGSKINPLAERSVPKPGFGGEHRGLTDQSYALDVHIRGSDSGAHAAVDAGADHGGQHGCDGMHDSAPALPNHAAAAGVHTSRAPVVHPLTAEALQDHDSYGEQYGRA